MDGLKNLKIIVDGTLKFSEDTNSWPMKDKKKAGRQLPMECLELHDLENVTFTSSSSSLGRGVIDGSGHAWWGVPLWGYVERG